MVWNITIVSVFPCGPRGEGKEQRTEDGSESVLPIKTKEGVVCKKKGESLGSGDDKRSFREGAINSAHRRE